MFNLEIDQPKFRGLKNLGATCYINTFLQVGIFFCFLLVENNELLMFF